MSLMVLPIWTGPDGADTGPLATVCATADEAGREVERCLARPRPGLRVVIVDDVTWRRVATYRLKRV